MSDGNDERSGLERRAVDPAGRPEPYVDGPTGPAPLASELRGDPGGEEGDRRTEGGAAAGATLGTVGGPVGMAVGGAVGATIGAAAEAADDRPDDVSDEIAADANRRTQVGEPSRVSNAGDRDRA